MHCAKLRPNIVSLCTHTLYTHAHIHTHDTQHTRRCVMIACIQKVIFNLQTGTQRMLFGSHIKIPDITKEECRGMIDSGNAPHRRGSGKSMPGTLDREI